MAVVALTGGTGFVGAHLIGSLLSQGHKVRALTRRPQTERQNVEWIAGSLEDEAALTRLVTGADAVVHLAALVKALAKRDFFAANADGTSRLIDSIEKAAPKARLVHVSSLAARRPDLSHYAASKYAAEKAVEALGADRDWVIVRPPGLYGPGDREILRLINAARRGFLPAPGDCRNRVSLLYGPDLADLLQGLTAPLYLRGQIVEVDDGAEQGYSYDALARHLTQGLGRSVRAVAVPAPLLLCAGGLTGIWAGLVRRPAMLTAMKARELLHPDWVVRPSGNRLADIWAPQHNFATGLAETLSWAQKKGLFK